MTYQELQVRMTLDHEDGAVFTVLVQVPGRGIAIYGTAHNLRDMLAAFYAAVFSRQVTA